MNSFALVYDEHGNNLLYYVFKYKVHIKYIILGQKKSTVVKMLCEKYVHLLMDLHLTNEFSEIRKARR